jgi:nucleoside-diphosphate-sugar epimerase
MILVTGGTGFLGRHLVAWLCHAGYQLRILTRHPDAYPWLDTYPNVEVVQGDLNQIDTLRDAMQDCRYVVHAAGLFSMWSSAGDFFATNVQGTDNLAQAAIENNVARMIYVSTVAVIGHPQPNRVVDEKHPPAPADTYQESKLSAERLLLQYHQQKQLSVVILRPGAFYGPHGEYAFNRLFFADAMRGLMMQMDGGNYVIFPAYIEDVAQAILLSLTEGREGEIYNICGQPISHQYAFDIVTELAHLPYPRIHMPGFIGRNFSRLLELIAYITKREPFYPIGLKSYVFNDWHVSSEKAKRELGFKPTPFYDGAQKTLAWYRAGKPQLGFVKTCQDTEHKAQTR